jgi:DNA-binding MarR family transcriptional regulator
MESVAEIETEVALLMRRAEATRRAAPDQAHRALDRAAYVILRHLDEHGPTKIGQLAAQLGLDASTVTRQVATMADERLVRRERDPADGRGTVISASATGAARLRAVRRARAELYQGILADWSDADRRTLATMLHRLNQSMDRHLRA